MLHFHARGFFFKAKRFKILLSKSLDVDKALNSALYDIQKSIEMFETCQQSVPSDVLELKDNITQEIENRTNSLMCFAKAWPLVY